MDKYRKKPILIVIEGPAGAGKTTIMKFLQNSFERKKRHVDILPEFSNSPLGRLIKDNSPYGHDKPDWLLGINGLMLFLSDKINIILEMARMDKEQIWICDRFISTQFVLGLKTISGKEDRLLAQKIIQQVFDWSIKKISEQSIFIFLDSNINVLKKRIEKRINRDLTQQELNNLENEITDYRKLANTIKAKNTFVVEANHSINDVGNKISKLIYSTWQQ